MVGWGVGAWLLVVAPGCDGRRDDDGPTGTPSDTGTPADPVTVALTVSTPTAEAPLVRTLHTEVTGSGGAQVTVSARWESPDHVVDVAFPAGGDVQDHLLLGFRAGRSYTLTVTAALADPDPRAGTATTTVDTDPLPAHFPRATVSAGAGAAEPGHTLLPMRSFGVGDDGELAIVFDEQGEVCFWLDVGDVMQDVRETDDGLLALIGDTDGRLVSYGWDGVARATYSVGPGGLPVTEAKLLHHDAVVVPGEPDHLVALGRETMAVPDYPADYDDPVPTAPRAVADDVIVDFRTDGTVIRETRLSELLSVHRIGYDSLSTTVDGAADWAHANAVLWDDGAYVVSLRHQDAIVKLDPVSGAIRWILGHPDNWSPELAALRLQPVGDVRWTYHQHGPHLGPVGPTGERSLVVFDNGNWQAAPWTGVPPVVDPDELQSRVAMFAIDEEARTVREVWSFDAPDGGRLFSEAVGDADMLPGGHVLSTWGFLDRLPDGTSTVAAGLGARTVRVIELDPGAPADQAQVSELYLWTDRADNDQGWTGYRADRIPSLYGRVVR